MKQVFTFPYALHSTSSFNSHAYPVQIDGRGHGVYFIVWSPIHYPHYVGHYKTESAAQTRADQINTSQSEWIYCAGFQPADMQKIYDWLNQPDGPAPVQRITRPEYEPHPETPVYTWCNQTQCYILDHKPQES
jgi:hypothetical protein